MQRVGAAQAGNGHDEQAERDALKRALEIILSPTWGQGQAKGQGGGQQQNKASDNNEIWQH